MRLSRLLMIPFAIAAGWLMYEMYFNYQYQYSYYLIIPVVAIAACLALYPQLDAIGYKWWAPKKDLRLERIIANSSPSTHWIKEDDYSNFISSCLTEIRKIDFIGMKVDDIPTDIKVMCIYPGMLIDYLFGTTLIKEYNRVVLYKHPFPSPQYNKWHSGEINHEDGVLLFSLEQLIPNYGRPGDFYHIGFDMWIRAFLTRHAELFNKGFLNEDIDWELADLDHQKAISYLGLDIVLPRHLNWQAFFNHPEVFKEQSPHNYEHIISKMRDQTT